MMANLFCFFFLVLLQVTSPKIFKKTVNVDVKKKLTTNFYFLLSKPLSAIEITFHLRFEHFDAAYGG